MARDVEKNIPLYFYDNVSGIFTGEVGSSGDSEDFTLPSGMTTIAPPSFLETQQARFDTDLQTWSVEYINPYDGLTQVEKDAWDAAVLKQQEIDDAQDKITGRLAEAVDNILMIFQRESTTLNLSAGELNWISGIRDDYADWILKKNS